MTQCVTVSSEAISQGAVLVRGDIIVDVGHASAMRRLYPDEEVHDPGEVALIPAT